MTRAEQRAIERADQERRDQRDIADFLALRGESTPVDRHAMAIRADARAAGMVTSQTVRVSPRWAASSPRAVGIATGTSDTSDGPTVRVIHADGSTEVRTVDSFRAARTSTRARRTTQPREVTQVERAGLVNNIGQDFS